VGLLGIRDKEIVTAIRDKEIMTAIRD